MLIFPCFALTPASFDKSTQATYYRWTGFLEGKRTTKTVSKEMAEECEKRIKNYRALQSKVDQIVEEALANAPWSES